MMLTSEPILLFARMTVALLALLAWGGCTTAHSVAAARAPAESKIPSTQQTNGPILLDGAELHTESGPDRPRPHRISRKVNLPTPGVWYVWLRVSTGDAFPALLTYDLNGKQLLRSHRKEVLIAPHLKSQWVNHSRHPGFKIELHVEQPGDHELGLTLISGGDVNIERIALTLFHSARPAGDTLDLTGDPAGNPRLGDFRFNRNTDPGLGKNHFPLGDLRIDGFRDDWKSPDVAATGQRYFVDSKAGDDASDGKSPEHAWRSFARINAMRFQPGDAILLKRGGEWAGGLSPRGSGAPDKWITVGAYGPPDAPRPRIDGRDRPGIALSDQSYWSVQDLEISNDPDHRRSGIEVLASKRAGSQPKGIRILNCIVYDTGGHGIYIGNDEKLDDANGYDGVVIEHCLSFWNERDGIAVGGADQNGCRNTVIRYCTAFSNPGMAGIWIHSGQNGLIEHCKAYNNACVNIWTWNSINITIRYCEAFRGRPPRDAGGFDIDWGCQGCVIEYCYSHHNEGVGYLVMGGGSHEYRGFTIDSRYNLMRYCVSEYDNPGIGTTCTLQHSIIHNNTVYAHGPGRVALSVEGYPEIVANWSGGGWPSDSSFVNNLLVAAAGATPLVVDHLATRQRNHFDRNLYWRINAPGGADDALVHWDGNRSGDVEAFWNGQTRGTSPPTRFATLAEFRAATGHEPHGIEVDPQLRAPGDGGYGRMPLNAYHIDPRSPAAGAGAAVHLSEDWLKARRGYLTETGAAAYGISMEPAPLADRDYWGNPIPAGIADAPASIGAHHVPKTDANALKNDVRE
jgi:hypothetical protein